MERLKVYVFIIWHEYVCHEICTHLKWFIFVLLASLYDVLLILVTSDIAWVSHVVSPHIGK
jgi:hypothetical protein